MRDLFDKSAALAAEDSLLAPASYALAAKLLSSISPPANAGPWIDTPQGRLLQFSSNDYLGLARHPEVLAQVRDVVERYGVWAPMGSRLMSGNTEYHLELERRVARLKRCEAAVTFSAGAMAMIGTLAAIADSRDLLILDENAHTTLRCGAKVSGARLRFFRHNDVRHLEHLLARADDDAGCAVVVDGVYSMSGDLAPLADIAALKKRYGFRLIVDDAHGTGVFGEQGRGTAAHFNVEAEVDLHLGTFSKAVGVIGGFAAGDKQVIDYICVRAPTFVFTKAMPLAMVAAIRVALDLLEKADAERAALWANARRLQAGLVAAGFDIGRTESPITPVYFPGDLALHVARQLRDSHGIWVSPVLFPAVKAGQSLIRLIPTAQHSADDIDYLIERLWRSMELASSLGTA